MFELHVLNANPKPLDPTKPQNALNPWHAVKPAYAYACLSIAGAKLRLFFQHGSCSESYSHEMRIHCFCIQQRRICWIKLY